MSGKHAVLIFMPLLIYSKVKSKFLEVVWFV